MMEEDKKKIDGRELFERDMAIKEKILNAVKEQIEVYKTTLRDQFAMSALTGLVQTYENNERMDDNDVCRVSYLYADEMLKAREVTNGQ